MKKKVLIIFALILMSICFWLMYKNSNLWQNNKNIPEAGVIVNKESNQVQLSSYGEEVFTNTCTDEDFSIAGINIITAKPKDVLLILGQPLYKSEVQGIWRYQDLEIEVGLHNIFRIKILDKKYKTKRGIAIGDSVNELLLKYGSIDEIPKSYHDQYTNGDNYYEYSNGLGYYISFEITNGFVSKIEIFYQT